MAGVTYRLTYTPWPPAVVTRFQYGVTYADARALLCYWPFVQEHGEITGHVLTGEGDARPVHPDLPEEVHYWKDFAEIQRDFRRPNPVGVIEAPRDATGAGLALPVGHVDSTAAEAVTILMTGPLAGWRPDQQGLLIPGLLYGHRPDPLGWVLDLMIPAARLVMGAVLEDLLALIRVTPGVVLLAPYLLGFKEPVGAVPLSLVIGAAADKGGVILSGVAPGAKWPREGLLTLLLLTKGQREARWALDLPGILAGQITMAGRDGMVYLPGAFAAEGQPRFGLPTTGHASAEAVDKEMAVLLDLDGSARSREGATIFPWLEWAFRLWRRGSPRLDLLVRGEGVSEPASVLDLWLLTRRDWFLGRVMDVLVLSQRQARAGLVAFHLALADILTIRYGLVLTGLEAGMAGRAVLRPVVVVEPLPTGAKAPATVEPFPDLERIAEKAAKVATPTPGKTVVATRRGEREARHDFQPGPLAVRALRRAAMKVLDFVRAHRWERARQATVHLMGLWGVVEALRDARITAEREAGERISDREALTLFQVALQMFKRWWRFVDAVPPFDPLIIPEDYPYERLPLPRLPASHPIPEGADMADLEIPVSVAVMEDVIAFLKTMRRVHYCGYAGTPGPESLRHLVLQLYEWLAFYAIDPEYREDYWRTYRWVRWYAEAWIINWEDTGELDGLQAVNALIEDLETYIELHWGGDKVKGRRHLWQGPRGGVDDAEG